jgi:AcrR family transcriptional regulator
MPEPVVWMRIAAQARARERALDYAAITRAAIAIADAEGLDAVSMRKVASAVDSGTMSLYRHINGKDDLNELMYDAVLGELDLGTTPTADWRTELAGLARRTRALQHRHPWMSRLGPRSTPGPNASRMMDYAMAGVGGLGLDHGRMLDLVSTALHFTHGFVQAELADLEARRAMAMDEDAWQDWIAPYLSHLFGDGPHPYPDGANPGAPADEVFERRLAMVLDGLAASLHGTSS